MHNNLSPRNQSQAHQLYRIAQETLNNALQHSKATEVELIWGEENGWKLLAVLDNGIGIGDNNRKAPAGHQNTGGGRNEPSISNFLDLRGCAGLFFPVCRAGGPGRPISIPARADPAFLP